MPRPFGSPPLPAHQGPDMPARPLESIRYLLLQVRNADDPMCEQEVTCFSRALACPASAIQVHNLISGHPPKERIDAVDAVLIGGSGDYSVVEGGDWLDGALSTFVDLFEQSKPTFASCWGFQAFARALGGEVVTDLDRAELGTIELTLTEAGRSDPVFNALPDRFLAPLGHQDIVDRLPEAARLLASSTKVKNEAFVFPGRPIYGTQFHPELDRAAYIERVEAYPSYIERITGIPADAFLRSLRETPDTDRLLIRFARRVAASL